MPVLFLSIVARMTFSDIKFSKSVKICVVISILFIILSLFFVNKNVYVVNDKGYERKIVIVHYPMKLDNGKIVIIDDACVVNNSERTLYVEDVALSLWSLPITEIAPYTVYNGNVDFVFSSSEKVEEGISGTTKKWLRY